MNRPCIEGRSFQKRRLRPFLFAEVKKLNDYDELDSLERDEKVSRGIRPFNRIYSPEHSARTEPERPVSRISPRCEGCPYPSHGFVCWSADGNCIRSRIAEINHIEKESDQYASDTLQ